MGHMSELLPLAHTAANENPGDPDPDLEVERNRSPHWASHSLRRLGDTVARRDMAANQVSKEEIDLYFGWHERILLREMQRHYSACSMRERMKQARITGRL